jgi:hypothetical protein
MGKIRGQVLTGGSLSATSGLTMAVDRRFSATRKGWSPNPIRGYFGKSDESEMAGAASEFRTRWLMRTTQMVGDHQDQTEIAIALHHFDAALTEAQNDEFLTRLENR